MYRPYTVFGMDEDVREVWLPRWAGIVWFFTSPRVAELFLTRYHDFMYGPIAPRAPLPGADSTVGLLLLTLALAYLPFVVPAALLRYTRWRDEDNEVLAWGAAGRLALIPAIAAALGLLAYTLVWLRHV